MSAKSGLVEEKKCSPESCDLNRPRDARGMVEGHAEELLWIAEVMIGTRQAAEQCLEETIELAAGAWDLGREWVLPWARRLLVHLALEQIGTDVLELSRPDRVPVSKTMRRLGATASERLKIRRLPPQRITASCNVFERTCFILYSYLQYTSFDCALLLGCPRSWVKPVCERVLARIVDITAQEDPAPHQLDSPISPLILGAKRTSFLSSHPEESSGLMRDYLPRRGLRLSMATGANASSSVLQDLEQFQVASSAALRSSKALLLCIMLAAAVLVFCLGRW
jgi:DNA-directed RNA polymerase specialized sigma24 family protein